ncbi:MAG: citrate lyase holo-[acyl-carrier protein] synthase [Vagococcus sp.]|uniref:citrate lyase holo-[acyl-carrier protein] synthase n=1 Tax=Vagococcus sp. TaxID=1933889 RepID=UPI002FCBC4E0
MSNNIFSGGKDVQLLEMLDAREKRQLKQQQLLEKSTNDTLISMTMNIPGSVKVTDELIKIFHLVYDQVKMDWQSELLHEELLPLKTGYEGYFLIKENASVVKKHLINLEEELPFGRLFDLDVLELRQEELVVLSRKDFNLSPRTCFICKENAKECGRSRSHSIEELQLAISDYINERRDMLNDKRS